MASEQALPREVAGRFSTAIRLATTARRWWVRGLRRLADQGLIAGTHFPLNPLPAGWLAPAEYGAFTLCCAVLLFSTRRYNAPILKPMGAVGPTRYPERLPGYLGLTIWMNAGRVCRWCAVRDGGLGRPVGGQHALAGAVCPERRGRRHPGESEARPGRAGQSAFRMLQTTSNRSPEASLDEVI